MSAALQFFTQGLWHPLVMPAHLMLLLALALLTGQQGVGRLAYSWLGLVAGLMAGIAFTLLSPLRWDLEATQLVVSMLIGLWVVLRWPMPLALLVLVALLVGLGIGLDSAAPRIPGLRGIKVYALQMGTVLSCALLSLVGSGLAATVRGRLGGIPLRVLGAWISAGSMLVLTLYLTKALS